MTSATVDPFAHTLAYQGRIPIEWQQALPPDAEAQRELDQQNQDLLDILLSLDDIEPVDEHHLVQHSLQRLDAKLNLLIGLVAELAARSQPRPLPRDMVFNAQWLQWSAVASETLPAKGESLRCGLYLRPEIPKPLLLNGRVSEIARRPDGARLTVELGSLSETVVERLEKYIFRWHRRRIAQSRHPE